MQKEVRTICYDEELHLEAYHFHDYDVIYCDNLKKPPFGYPT
jgi:hypothetical protein